jgi:hypothetical protein
MTNETKQTAVDWLYEELLAQFHLQIDSFIAHELKGKLEQAKEMEKEQIEQAKLDAKEIIIIKYTETYGGNK